ncbi:MAG: DUF3025 domain-containing protein [Burkholderiaceae bacterium]
MRELGLSVDWAAPWWGGLHDGLRERGAAVLAHGLPLHQALNATWAAQPPAGGVPVRFVPQSALPEGQAYESHLWHARECPTRDNAHDFFNGLMWMRFPRTKRRINELQAAQIARCGIQGARGPVRDALTLLDENGALLLAPPERLAWLHQVLRERRWHEALVQRRADWAGVRLLILGHALLEKLLSPRKDLTAHVWCAPLPDIDTAPLEQAVDTAWAASLTPQALAAKPFVPLPVLGVPGWWPANEDAAFYDDARVFRPARQ